VVVDHELSPDPAAQPRARDGRGGARSHRGDPGDLPPSREAARRGSRSRSRGSLPGAAAARVGRRRRPQRGGIGGKGAGESALELDRRKIRDRIAELRRELDAIAQSRTDNRRARPQEQRRVALVGYTNAGKSSLMRALTGSEVYVADKLFATLDTTVRALTPRRSRACSSPTRSASSRSSRTTSWRRSGRRSTRRREATLLLHVVDASDPAFRAHTR
jgi:GTP-binding protein HflX